MPLSPQICKKNVQVFLPTLGTSCEYWLVTVTDVDSITDPDRDHAYLTDSGDFYVYNGSSIVKVGFNPVYTTKEDIDEFVPSYVVDPGGDDNPDVSTNNYNDLENKPSINSVTLIGDKTTDDLDIYDKVTDEEIDSMF